MQSGTDFFVEETMKEDPNHVNGWQSNHDARIVDWRVSDIPEPTEPSIMKTWEILEEQYHVDPTRPDSKIFKYMKNKGKSEEIVVNEDL